MEAADERATQSKVSSECASRSETTTKVIKNLVIVFLR